MDFSTVKSLSINGKKVKSVSINGKKAWEVSDNLVEQYKSATNCSEHVGQIKPLSDIEVYVAD